MSRPLPFARALLCLLFSLSAPLPARAEIVAVETLVIPEMKAVFGQVESRIVVPARARIGGTVRQIKISEGDQAKEGQVLALVVDDKLALQLNASAARVEALASQLENARLQLERAQQLKASGSGTQASLDQARTQYEVANNQVTAAKADRAVIEQNAREGSVLAPATGRVLTVPVTPGSVVLPGEEIARIAPGPYYLRLSLPERHAAEIVQGAEVAVRGRGVASDGGSREPRKGRIVKVYPEISDGRVIADVEVDGIGDFFVNERTLVSIPVGKRTVRAVPPEAVRTVHGVDYVRLATKDGAQDVAVILGETFSVSGVTRVEVLTGLADGDQVIVP